MRIQHTRADATSKLTSGLKRSLFHNMHYAADLVVVCIGSDRSTGDALGPLVGSRLAERDYPFPVYGTLDSPVHAQNIHETLARVEKEHPDRFVIAVDACLGQLSSVGWITMGNGSMNPGAGVGRKLPPVGDMYITGIVNVAGFMEFFVLQNTRLSMVMRMTDIIAEAIVGATVHPVEEVAAGRSW